MFQISKTLILRIILRKLQNSEKNSKNKKNLTITILVNTGPYVVRLHCSVDRLESQAIVSLVRHLLIGHRNINTVCTVQRHTGNAAHNATGGPLSTLIIFIACIKYCS